MPPLLRWLFQRERVQQEGQQLGEAPQILAVDTDGCAVGVMLLLWTQPPSSVFPGGPCD